MQRPKGQRVLRDIRAALVDLTGTQLRTGDDVEILGDDLSSERKVYAGLGVVAEVCVDARHHADGEMRIRRRDSRGRPWLSAPTEVPKIKPLARVLTNDGGLPGYGRAVGRESRGCNGGGGHGRPGARGPRRGVPRQDLLRQR